MVDFYIHANWCHTLRKLENLDPLCARTGATRHVNSGSADPGPTKAVLKHTEAHLCGLRESGNLWVCDKIKGPPKWCLSLWFLPSNQAEQGCPEETHHTHTHTRTHTHTHTPFTPSHTLSHSPSLSLTHRRTHTHTPTPTPTRTRTRTSPRPLPRTRPQTCTRTHTHTQTNGRQPPDTHTCLTSWSRENPSFLTLGRPYGKPG